MNIKKVKSLDKNYLESIGFNWHTDNDKTNYVADELIQITQEEANAYYEAANELYDMYVKAAEHVIENDLFFELGIPFNLIDIIKSSWENDVHWHLYGRFDFAGGIDGEPIKLLEFNADTPTSLFESAIIQWALLKANNLNEEMQFNNIYESIKDNFKRLITLDENVDEFEKLYEGWKILFTSHDNIEDENTTRLLQVIANEAGFHTNFCYINEVSFSDEEGVFLNDEKYEYLFKLIPWESIAVEEGELALILENIIKNQQAIILNPAYTLLFQSKAMLKILWDLYPNHPLLLESSFEPLKQKCVAKPFLAREGANIQIIQDKNVIHESLGEYENQPKVYQEYVNLSKNNNESYQAGVFFAYEACGVGFRKGNEILDNFSKFVAHYIKN